MSRIPLLTVNSDHTPLRDLIMDEATDDIATQMPRGD
jgi:hypothetical protein